MGNAQRLALNLSILLINFQQSIRSSCKIIWTCCGAAGHINGEKRVLFVNASNLKSSSCQDGAMALDLKAMVDSKYKGALSPFWWLIHQHSQFCCYITDTEELSFPIFSE